MTRDEYNAIRKAYAAKQLDVARIMTAAGIDDAYALIRSLTESALDHYCAYQRLSEDDKQAIRESVVASGERAAQSNAESCEGFS